MKLFRWSIYVLPVTMGYRFTGFLLPDGAFIWDQLLGQSFWALDHCSRCVQFHIWPWLVRPIPLQWIHTQHAQIQPGWWHQSYFFLCQTLHSHCSYLLRVVGIGEQGQTETHKYSFREIRYVSLIFNIVRNFSLPNLSQPPSSHVFTDTTLLTAFIKITNELHLAKANHIFQFSSTWHT